MTEYCLYVKLRGSDLQLVDDFQVNEEKRREFTTAWTYCVETGEVAVLKFSDTLYIRSDVIEAMMWGEVSR